MAAMLALFLVLSGPSPFSLVNGTGTTLTEIQARTVNGEGQWSGLGPGRLSPGARGAVPALGAELCVLHIRARDGGTELVWRDVNLCDVKVVTLNRRPDGTLWVDYD